MMSIEQIQLFGGPRHGQSLAIPDGGHDDLAVDITVLHRETKAPGTRQGHYTRVHTVNAKPLSEFEWVGYSTPFVPLESETSA